MCGIFGILAPNASNEWVAQLTQRLFRETQTRGTDASGIAYFAQSPEGDAVVRVLKKPLSGSRFANDEELRAILYPKKGNTPKVLIGHCRAKTQGDEKENENNHPLQSKETGIAVVHNGRVSDYMWRATNEAGENPYLLSPFVAEVDTEAILQLIDTLLFIPRNADQTIDPEIVAATPKDQWPKTSQVSTMKAIDDAVFNLSGGQACALLDPGEPDSIFLWKVKNPIYIAWLEEQQAIVFASTETILKAALETTKTEYKFDFFEVKKETITPKYIGRELPEEWLAHITFDPDAASPDDMFDFDIVDLKPDAANFHTVTNHSRKVEASKDVENATIITH